MPATHLSQKSKLAKAEEFCPTETEIARLKDRAKFIRLETIRLIEIAKVGHYTSVFFRGGVVFSALLRCHEHQGERTHLGRSRPLHDG